MKPIADDSWFREKLLKRLLDYVRIDTTSKRHAESSPSTPGQRDFALKLSRELEGLGVAGLEVDEKGFLWGGLPARSSRQKDTIGLMAHLDTSDAAPGKDINPQVHENYGGEAIPLAEGLALDPAEYPDLLRYRGDIVVTSDGSTLLGADDKAGIAEIVTAVEFLSLHSEHPHPSLQIIFTPDEELGLSMERMPRKKISSRACYTLDGGEEGTIEAECFEAAKAVLLFRGKSMHTGTARGKLVNAIEMAAGLLAMLPGEESPQATDGRYGFYHPQEVQGNVEEARLEMLLRDFEEAGLERRAEAVRLMARAVEASHPGGKVEVTVKKQYMNMRRFLGKAPEVVARLEEAVRRTGIEPEHRIIRGGTDGARLSELGIPSPNIFTGGHNYHSRLEWVPLSAMVRATRTIINLVRIWAEGD